MDRRAAGALLALAACFACSAAAPTASNQTALDLYEGSPEGCYYNFQHYGEGDRIMTNEPCLNCTCHNRMLMCYLRVCPFTKAIGQDCTVEKRADQCCPIVTCPDVPVDLLTSTSTTSPAEYGATGLGKLDKYGCSINGKYFPEGSKVPPTPNKPCEHCYCIRNMTTCVMQECTLHVDGCTPIYHKDVCCPVRYSCDHLEDEIPLLDDMSTTVRPTPGFLLTTTTMSPVTQMTQDCVHDDRIFSDGASIRTEKACEHCYCMKGDIVCVVQECGAPMENEGKNCTSLLPREGQCCPDTYICEGDELTSDLPTELTTESILEKLTTLSPPRRTSVEGSGYRNEPDEVPYTDMTTVGSEVEGSGDEDETSKPLGPDEIIPTPGEDDQYIYVTTKRPAYEDHGKTTVAIDEDIITDTKDKTVEPHVYLSTTNAPASEEVEKLTTTGFIEEETSEPHKYVPTTSAPESITTELGDLHNTVPDVIPDEEIVKPHEYAPSTTNVPSSESETPSEMEGENDKLTSHKEDDVITSATLKPEYSTTSSSTLDEIQKETSTPTDISNVTPEVITEKEYSDGDITRTTSGISDEEDKESSKPELLAPSTTIQPDKESSLPEELAPSTTSSTFEEEKESSKPESLIPSTTIPLEKEEKITTVPDHAQNTVVAEEDSTYPHLHIKTTTEPAKVGEEITTEFTPVTKEEPSDMVSKKDEPSEVMTAVPVVKETDFTTVEPDRGLNTIPSEIYEEGSSASPLPEKTTLSEKTKITEPSIITDETPTQGVDMKSPTDSDLTTPQLDIGITKGEQFTITTEPSFRKEDEGVVSTEKQKEILPTTVKSEFVDEGLIPTSSHDDKIGTSSDIATPEEDFTTSLPEYITEIAETVGYKQTTTESSKEPSVVTEIQPDKVSEPPTEQDGDLSSSTEKLEEVTPTSEINEEPSRIPGEGDCLLNGVTYRNNTVVPSTNNCHTGCRCASSIIKCDPIICSPPPDYMDNCQSIYDSPDSCCPTFVCDHPRETVPPQSDNQMSGTESPVSSPTIECRGDQCEISVPTKQPSEPSEPCSSDECLTVGDHKTESECGSEGCGEVSQKPDTSLPSVEHTEECSHGKCKSESCANGECHQTQVSPVTPCEGEHCEKTNEVVPESPQQCKDEKDCKTMDIPSVDSPCEGDLCTKIDAVVPETPKQCKNEEDCKTMEIPTEGATPCEGESCNKIDCGDGGCSSDVNISPPDHQPELCKDEDGCKPQDIPTPECKGDEPCRRKETSTSDTKLPTTCEGPNCIGEKETTQSAVELNTELPKTEQTPFDEATDNIVPDEDDKATKLPDSHISKPSDDNIPEKDTQEANMYTTEGQTEKPTVEDEATKIPVPTEEKETDTPAVTMEGDKEKPGAEEESTQKLDRTETSVLIKEETTKPTMLIDEGEGKPTIDEENSTEEPAVTEKEDQEPIIEQDTEKPVLIDEDDKEKPDSENIKKPEIIDEDGLTKTEISKEEETSTLSGTEDKSTDTPAVAETDTEKPSIIDEASKDKPVDAEKETKEPMGEEDKDKPEQKPIEEVSSEKPALVESGGTDKNAIEEATENPDVIKEETTDTVVVPDESEEEKPSYDEDKTTDKTTVIEETRTEIPDMAIEDGDKKPDTVEDDKEKPAISDDSSTEKPAVIDEGGKEKPLVEDGSKKPSTVYEHEDTEKSTEVDKEITETPSVEQDNKTETAVIDQDSTEKSVTSDDSKPTSPEIEGEPKDKPTVVPGTTQPEIVDEEKSSESPVLTITEGTGKPAVDEIESTKKPSDVDRESTELPVDIGDENTRQPVVIDEEITKKPITEEDTSLITEEDGIVKPVIIDEGTEEPTVTEKEDTMRPAVIEREGTELPDFIGEDITKKPVIIDDDTKEKPDISDKGDMPAVIEKETDKPGVLEEATEEPSIFKPEGTDKPALIDDEGKPVDENYTKKPIQVDDQEQPVIDKEEKPIIIDEEVTDKPILVDVVSTEEPKTQEEEGSGTGIPEVSYTTEPEKSPEESEITGTEIEKTTKTPYSGSQTSIAMDIVHAPSTESQDASTSAPEINVTDADSKEPGIQDHSYRPEITTESLIEQEFTTKSSVTEPEKTDVNQEGSTAAHDLISEEPALITKAPESYETSEPAEKTTEKGLTSEQEEISTDVIEIESPTTKATGEGLVKIEPQEGIDTDQPEPHVTSKTEEESTTKTYEEDKLKPSSESQVTESSSTSPAFETSDGVTDEHKTEYQSPELHGAEPDKTTTQVPQKQTDRPEVYSSEKEEPITETQVDSVTEPINRFTEIEDTFVTGQEDKSTRYPEETTDHGVPSITDKAAESESDDVTSSEKTPLTDMESRPVTKEPEGYQTPETEKDKPTDEIEPTATVVPISTVTESHEIPDVSEKDVTSYDEKTTIIPELPDDKHTATTPPNEYTEQQEPNTEVPQHHVTSVEDEIKLTGPHVTEPQETSTKSVEQEEKDSQKEAEPSITELPISSEDVRTELPGADVSSETPQSLVTEQKESLGEQTTIPSIPKEETSSEPELLTTRFEEISKAPDHVTGQAEIQTEAPVHVTESIEVSLEPVTEKQDTATTLRESPAVTEEIQQIEVIKSTEDTSAQTEVSETTPYSIELQEHTHKIIEDFTTVSPSEEEHSDKTVEDISTSLPSEDEHTHKPVERLSTASPYDEEHSYKPVDDTSTVSASEDEHSYKPIEDISTVSASEDEHSHKPVEDISTSSPTEDEHSFKPVEETLTSSPSEEEHSQKPVEISTSSPVEDEDSYKPIKDITTSSPTDEEPPHKPMEDSSTSSPSEEEHSFKPMDDISTLPVSEEEHSHKPEVEVTTSLPSEDEHSYKPVDEISTSSPVEEEHPYKPAEDISTSSPPDDEHSLTSVDETSSPSPSEDEHSYKPVEDISTSSPFKDEHSYKPNEEALTSSPSEEEYSQKPVEDVSTSSPFTEENTPKIESNVSTVSPTDEKLTTAQSETEQEPVTKKPDEEMATATKETEATTILESVPVQETTPAVVSEDDKYGTDHKDYTTSAPTQVSEESTPAIVRETDKLPVSESDIAVTTEKDTSASEKPTHPIISQDTSAPEEEFIFSTTKATTSRQDEDIVTSLPDIKPEEKPVETSEVPPSSTTTEVSKPSIPDLQPTDEMPVPDEDGHFPPSGTSGYGEPDYVEEDQAFGPGTCRYGGKVYVSAQQIPRDDPCDFCFCFRSDIICLQQSCPPPIHGCHEEPIQGFCCPRYECPVSMATTVNVTTTTTTTTTTLPPHFPTHSYKGAAQRRGCQIKGHTYKVGEVVRSSSGPCLHCTCGGDGQMKCDPKACTPEPMLRQMIAAAVSAKRRR